VARRARLGEERRAAADILRARGRSEQARDGQDQCGRRDRPAHHRGASILRRAKAGVEHWHGAAPDQDAVQLTIYEGDVKWLEAVPDEAYKAAPQRK